MIIVFTVEFWRNLLERAVKSAAQGAALVLTGGEGFDLFSVDAKLLVAGAAFGALYSILASLGSEAVPLGNPGTASLAKSVVAVDPRP